MVVGSIDEHSQIADEAYWRTPSAVSRHYTVARFGQLHYRLARPPTESSTTARVPLVCFHLTPNSSRIYNALLTEMGRDRLVFAVDTPGFGLSDPPASSPTIADYSACMGDFIEQMASRYGFRQVDLFGYHTGSKIALILARQQPKRIRRLTLVSAPIYTAEELIAQQRALATPMGEPWPEHGEPLQRRWQDHWRWRDELAGAWFVQREVAEGLHNLEESYRAYSAAFAVQHASELPQVHHPVMVLCPGDDLREPTLRAKSLIKNGRFIERWHWSHGFLDVHTEECGELLRDFLDGDGDDRGNQTIPLATPEAPAIPEARMAQTRGFHEGLYGPLHYTLAKGPADSSQPPIVLLHMSPNSSRVFDTLIPVLAKTRPVLAVDTPGFGESEAPQAPIGIEQFAAAMLDLVEALGLNAVDVLGYHTGAMTAIEMALVAPSKIKHVVQVSSPIYTPAEQARARAQYQPRQLTLDGSHLVNAWRSLQTYYEVNVPQAIMGRNFTSSLRGGPMSHWGHQAAFAYPLAEKLPRVTQPVLIINPEDDLVEETRRAPALLTGVRLLELPGRSHGFMDQMTEEFARILADFLDDRPPQ
jgi:pimeloyl-ACP methyl ester carboxylesterase